MPLSDRRLRDISLDLVMLQRCAQSTHNLSITYARLQEALRYNNSCDIFGYRQGFLRSYLVAGVAYFYLFLIIRTAVGVASLLG